ncbi:metal-dependent hydrolase [Paenibacillus sp. NEAU-GSW1]|uniref:metal-dependent hydrolase n=1 Tax=Paenibacillus sp. NEAU-GSW1 TaxID=2682486 RepID=UPI0012E159E4|nr:metal-dependent hydrolase [Paenibacillus sp. NEAU-GSW1]MUT65259.1 metal-dependent hydrolase [Paenibacillus sp. NEAU-GSW1]
MHIQYHGHSCIQVTANGHSVIIDPYITENPSAVVTANQIRVSHVLATHGHSDHITDAVNLAKLNDAPIIAIEELAYHLAQQGVQTEPMHCGGEWDFGFGRVRFTPATHASSYRDERGQLHYAGTAAGILLEIDGVTIYHAGDTGLFQDMKWLGERYRIDAAFLPIGGRFTMGPEDALIAAEWLQARLVIPIHSNTFPVIKQDNYKFVESLAERGIRGKAMEPGETISVCRREQSMILNSTQRF